MSAAFSVVGGVGLRRRGVAARGSGGVSRARDPAVSWFRRWCSTRGTRRGCGAKSVAGGGQDGGLGRRIGGTDAGRAWSAVSSLTVGGVSEGLGAGTPGRVTGGPQALGGAEIVRLGVTALGAGTGSGRCRMSWVAYTMRLARWRRAGQSPAARKQVAAYSNSSPMVTSLRSWRATYARESLP